MNLEELRKHLKALQAEAQALAEKKEWTDEESARVQSLPQEIKDAKDKIATYQALLDAAASEAPPVPAGSAARVTPASGAQGPFDTFGEQLQAIRAAGTPGGVVDERLVQIMNAAGDGSTEGTPSEGGWLVQGDKAAEIIRRIYDNSQILGRCQRRTISSGANSIELPGIDETSRADGSRFGGVRAYWKGEAAQYTSSKPKFEMIKLELNKLTALYFASDEVLEDAPMLEGEVMNLFAGEIEFKIQDALIRGTGAGQPMGILNASCKVQQAKETGQAAATIVAENIMKMYSRAWAGGLTNSVWLINQECWPQLFQLHIAVGTGGVPLFVPPGGMSAAPYGTLLGLPIIPIEQCAALGTAGDIVLADFSQYVVAEKGGMKMAQSIHLKFDYGQTAFRWTIRMDGQPRWVSALTPYKGSATQSPFITLATRG